jgi:CheY-like chemotaxis protein
VLVVDDDEDTAEGMALLLSASGHAVRVAHDGPAALATALEFHPHVVLTDIGVPIFNGYEIAARMRQHPDLARTVLVAITGYRQEQDRVRTRAGGFDHYMVKPAEPDEVLRIVSEVAAGLSGGLHR